MTDDSRLLIATDSYTNDILVILRDMVIPYSFGQLNGTVQHRARIILAFRDGHLRVLVVNSRDEGAGVDLPFLTDLVIFQNPLNIVFDHQLVARGQRIGRTQPLIIHRLSSYPDTIILPI